MNKTETKWDILYDPKKRSLFSKIDEINGDKITIIKI